jgi:hypothetical protein
VFAITIASGPKGRLHLILTPLTSLAILQRVALAIEKFSKAVKF